MSFVDKLKNLAVTQVPVEVPEEEQKNTKAPAAHDAPVVVTPPVLKPLDTAAVDPKVREVLEKDVALAAKPAYSEFNVLMDSMAQAIPSEAQRSAAALAVLAGKGMTVKDVLFDIDECFQALDKKVAEFTAAEKQERQKAVGSREAQLQGIDDNIKMLEAQLQKAHDDKAKIQGEIGVEDRRIAETSRRFTTTVEAYKRELAERRQRILSNTNGVK